MFPIRVICLIFILFFCDNGLVEARAFSGFSNSSSTASSSTTEDFQTLTETFTVDKFVTETLVGPSQTGEYAFVLTGPETVTMTFTGENGDYVHAAPPPTTGTQCSGTGVSTESNRYVTFAELQTIINGPTVVTTTSYGYAVTNGVTGTNYGTYTLETTYTAPTTISTTFTTVLGPQPDMDPAGALPGEICGGICGGCNVYYPTVSVFYFPPATQNTACLTTAAPALPTQRRRNMVDGYPIEARQLGGNASIVVMDDFTFTSPSAYIAFPTISAANLCGLVGQVHTSLTLGYAPGQLSTLIGNQQVGFSSYPFDFADALCPPASLADVLHVSFIGQGYRPIIAPPPDLTSIDEAWVSHCQLADGFQGNDPPYAITPVANGPGAPTFTVPPPVMTTQGDPAAETTAASPSSPPAAIPTSTKAAPKPPVVTSTKAAAPNPPVATSTKAAAPNSPVATSTKAAAPQPGSAQSSSPAPESSSESSPESASRSSDPNTEPSSFSVFSSPVTATPEPAPPVSSGSGGPIVVPIGGQTFTIGSSVIVIPSQTLAVTPPAVITIGGSAVTATSSAYVIGSQTLAPGGTAITFSGNTVSLASVSAGATPFIIVDGTSTSLLPIITPAPVRSFSAGELLTIGASVYTAGSNSEFIIGTQTLEPGDVITVSGTLVSLDPAATEAVVGTSTEDIGAFIMSGFAGGVGGNATSTITPFTSAAQRISGENSIWVLVALLSYCSLL